MIDSAQAKQLANQSGATQSDNAFTFDAPALLAFARACFTAGQENMLEQQKLQQRMQRRDVFIPEDYTRAIHVMVEEDRVSVSLVQRRLEIPYNRAREYVELAISEGYVKKPDWMKESEPCD